MDHLERDIAPERLLDRLVNDPHPAPAQLANDPELAELRWHRSRRLHLRRRHSAPPQPLDHRHRRQQLADRLGMLGIALQVLGDRWRFAPSTALDKLFGHAFERVAIAVACNVDRVDRPGLRIRVVHVEPPSKPGICSSTLLSRSTARTYRLLAAAGLIASAAAAS